MEKQKTLEPVSKPLFFDDLPEDIIYEILVRLPARTLVRFKFVCKLWLQLISNPKFVKIHVEKSHLLNNYNNHMIIFTHRQYVRSREEGVRSHMSCFIKSLPINFNDESNVVALDYLARDTLNEVAIVGTCNGLVCIAIDQVRFYLWNPCTRILRKLSYSGMKIYSLMMYGFGYDQFSDDYKLVFTGYFTKVVEVYSLKSDSWRKIGKFPYNFYASKCMARHVNGVLHWMVKEYVKDSKDFTFDIVSLDLGNESYGEIKQPFYKMGSCFDQILCVLEGCLSVFFRCTNYYSDIWVMKEYGNSDTWIKLYTIPSYPMLLLPLCISATGEILTYHKIGLFFCNPNNSQYRTPNCNSLLFRNSELYDVTTCVESLVSPNIYD